MKHSYGSGNILNGKKVGVQNSIERGGGVLNKMSLLFLEHILWTDIIVANPLSNYTGHAHDNLNNAVSVQLIIMSFHTAYDVIVLPLLANLTFYR